MNDVQNENYTEKKYAFPSNIISIISSIPVLGLELDEKRGIWELILFPRSDIVGPQCAFVFFSDSEGSFLCHSI